MEDMGALILIPPPLLYYIILILLLLYSKVISTTLQGEMYGVWSLLDQR